ncbi:MAG: M28 family peptidase [Bacteroidales bacterium]|nr:M28 family peptidase [Candidatus Cacconaster merdequi]
MKLVPKLLLVTLASLCCVLCGAQSPGYLESLVSKEKQIKDLSYLASEMTKGRASGSSGKQIAEQYIVSRFRECSLVPFNWHFTQSFRYRDSLTIRNVIGWIPSSYPSDEYIVVSAHYDHLGEIAGKIYPGADDNASGVAVLLSLAEAFDRMKKSGVRLGKNIIFVAFDGKELNMCGSGYFIENLPFPKKSVVCDVNIDMIGTDLAPTGIRKDYIIEVGEETLPQKYRGSLENVCFTSYRIDLDQSFYGSRDFRRMFYGMSDQISFSKAGIPAVVFSSAFHQHTYKTTDKKEIINFPLMHKRTLVILRFIKMLCDN